MMRERLALGFGFVLTALYAGAMFASLNGRAEAWSQQLNHYAVHVLGGLVVLVIVVNLARRESPKP